MEAPHHEASGRHCAFCLVSISSDKAKVCGGCKRRAYCSRECQKDDWSVGKPGSQVHKNWCKLGCGEEDLDWEVVEVPGKGLGLIAKRLFPEKSQILVDAIRPKSHPGIQDLTPLNGTLEEKVAFNCFSDGEGGIVVCLRISRVNHNCHANANHFHDVTFNCKILYARRDIQKGEEICINYEQFHDISSTTSPEESRFALRTKWGIHCKETCFCRNEDTWNLVEEGRKLSSSIFELALEERYSDSLEAVEKLLKIEDAVQSSYASQVSTLYGGYHASMMDKNNQHKAEAYIRQAYEIASAILASPKSEYAQKLKFLMNPDNFFSFAYNEILQLISRLN